MDFSLFNSVLKISKKLKLLYVEDNKEAQIASLSILGEIFDDIIVASDGKEGLAAYQNNNIDIIMTDINMPVMNGLEMISTIRKSNNSIPILILSAQNESEYFLKSIEYGVDGYIVKPMQISQLLEVLHRVTQKLVLKKEHLANLNILNQYQDITDKSAIVSKTDVNGIITYVNDEFCNVSGYTKEELIGKPHNIIRHPENPKEIYKELWDVIKNKKTTWQGVIKNRKKDGSVYYAKSTIKPILDQDGNILEFIGLRDDITKIMNPKKRLTDYVDSREKLLVVFLKIEDYYDLERFYGEKTIDAIQEDFLERLKSIISNEYNFEKSYSLGDGEFALACDISKKDIDLSGVHKKLKSLLNIIKEQVFVLSGVEYSFSVIASYAIGKEDVLQCARFGLKYIEDVKTDIIFANDFVKDEQIKAEKNLQTIQKIKTAILNKNIVSYFQPIVDSKTKKIKKYESLVRLIDTNGEVLSPFHFLDIAKKSRYYTQITNEVLENSFDVLIKQNVDITINISSIDVETTATREKVLDFLKQNPSYGAKITFEMLEDESIKELTLMRDFIKEVKSYGARIAIDDFGSGYSNFQRLLDYEPDMLKIDGSLIKNITKDTFALSVVETIVSFAKKQNLKLVAEFVETQDASDLLEKLGIDYIQGYLYGKPQKMD